MSQVDWRLQSLFSLEGRTALITGGTSGIGEMIARGLLAAGAGVWITGRSIETAADKAQELSQFGVCRAIAGDLATAEGRAHVVAEVRAQASDLSILVNNAGMTEYGALGAYSEAQWDAVYDLNVKAPFMLMQDLWPLLKANATERHPSQVINIGSVAGLRPHSHEIYAYGGSKAALHHLTRVMAKRLAPDRIHVNAIAPGLFPSQLSAGRSVGKIPAGRPGEPQDIAALAIAMVSNAYMTGEVVLLDGGLMLGTEQA